MDGALSTEDAKTLKGVPNGALQAWLRRAGRGPEADAVARRDLPPGATWLGNGFWPGAAWTYPGVVDRDITLTLALAQSQDFAAFVRKWREPEGSGQEHMPIGWAAGSVPVAFRDDGPSVFLPAVPLTGFSNIRMSNPLTGAMATGRDGSDWKWEFGSTEWVRVPEAMRACGVTFTKDGEVWRGRVGPFALRVEAVGPMVWTWEASAEGRVLGASRDGPIANAFRAAEQSVDWANHVIEACAAELLAKGGR